MMPCPGVRLIYLVVSRFVPWLWLAGRDLTAKNVEILGALPRCCVISLLSHSVVIRASLVS